MSIKTNLMSEPSEKGELKLYGDGLHDDFEVIQAMLDSRTSEVSLPSPKECYMISKTLSVHSGQSFRLSRFTIIRLMADSNCLMIKNADPHNDKNISVEGGIWDMNHNKQLPNPFRFPPDELDNKKYYESPHSNIRLYEEWNKNALESKRFLDVYCGMAMQFNGIENFTLKGVTIKNPVVYGVQVAYLKHFLIEDITFDYSEGSPKLWNLDGVHLEGGCKYGVIRNLRGNCHDDTVALTADDSLHGEIDNILIDGIFAEGSSHSAVRLLSYKTPVRNIKIKNIFGNFYQYCVGLTKYRGTADDRGIFENISVDNVYASHCAGTQDVEGGNCAFMIIESGLKVSNLSFENIFRNENYCEQPLFYIRENTSVNNLILSNVKQKHGLNLNIPFLINDGEIDKLIILNCDNQGTELISGYGSISEADVNK